MLLFVLLTYVLGSVASPSILNQTHIVLHVSFRLRSHNIFWDMYDWCYLGSKNLLGWCLYPRSGGRDLTASGSYPYEFGHRVARLHTTFMESKPGYGVTSDLDALFKSGYQDCTLYQLTGCFCCEPLSVWICLWCGLGVNVLIYIYIHWDYIYILNIDIDIEPYLPIFLGLPCDLQTLGRTLAWHGSLRIWFLSRRCWLQQPRQESMNLTLCYLST